MDIVVQQGDVIMFMVSIEGRARDSVLCTITFSLLTYFPGSMQGLEKEKCSTGKCKLPSPHN